MSIENSLARGIKSAMDNGLVRNKEQAITTSSNVPGIWRAYTSLG